MKKCILITGATGFIGRHLCAELHRDGYEVIALSRNVENAEKILGKTATSVYWDGKTNQGWQKHAEGALAIINLAGANIAGGLWTEKYKQMLLDSRIDSTSAVVRAIQNCKEKPEVLLQGSAIGYYGNRGDEVLTESSGQGKGFLADLVAKWEKAAEPVTAAGVRLCYLRTGIVLGKSDGFVAKLLTPFKFFLGGAPGSGKQWISWIHIEDEVRAIRFLLEHQQLSGPFNLVAPEAVRMSEFCEVFGQIIKRPSWLPIPEFALKVLMGEMAEETALTSQRVMPTKLLENRFKFAFPAIKPALQDILD